MAFVEYRADTETWRVRYREAGKNKSVGGFPTKREADEVLRRIETAHRRGETWRRSAPTRPSFDEVGVEWVKWSASRLRPKTLVDRAARHKRFATWLHGDRKGVLRFDQIDLETIEAYHASLVGRGRSVLYANLEARAVHNLWLWASGRDRWSGLIDAPPRLSLPTDVPRVRPDAPTWEEADRVVHAANGWYRDLLLVLRYTGLRMTQAMHLRWEHVDLGTAMLTIPPNLPGSKSKLERRGRFQPLALPLVAELATWGRRQGWLIDRARVAHANAGDPDHRRVHNASLEGAWRRAGLVEEDGTLRYQPTHAFRKAFRTHLRAAGVDSETVGYLIGRRTGLDGDTYTVWRHLEPQLRDAVSKIPPISTPAVLLDERRDAKPGTA